MQTLTGINEQPSIIQASDGTLQLVWAHIALNGISNIYYSSRLTNGTWACNCSITNKGGHNLFPSIVQAANGTIFVFWGYKAATSTHYQIYYQHMKGTVWSQYAPVPLQTSTSLNDTMPSAAVARDGTMWLVWTRDNSTATGTHVMRQLWYETMNSTGWSKREASITSTSDINWNFQPSITIGKNSVPRIVYSRGQNTLANFQINYAYYTSTGWSQPRTVSASNSTADDENPSLLQDRNGTFWVFWTRSLTTNHVLRGAYSLDNGTSWQGETQLTSGCSGCPESEYPSAAQSTTDKNIWVIYSTNPGPTGFDLYSLVTVRPITPVHDVTISTSIGSYGANATLAYAGGFHNPYAFISQSAVVLIFITVRNLGDFAENASVSITATNTTNFSLGSQVVSLPVGSSPVATFAWNTSGIRPARYGIFASASIPVETIGNRGDNTLAKSGILHLIPVGDVDQDGSDTLTDVSFVFYNYGFGCSAPGFCSPRYNPWADPSGLGSINIIDIGIVSNNFDTYS